MKAEVVLGAEGEEAEEGTAVDEEDGIKADDWKAIAIDHRLTPTPASQEIEKGTTAAIIYKLERYTSKTGEWSGYGGQTVQLEATGGSVAPTSAVTLSPPPSHLMKMLLRVLSPLPPQALNPIRGPRIVLPPSK